MRYSLRTLVVVMLLLPPAIAWLIWQPEENRETYIRLGLWGVVMAWAVSSYIALKWPRAGG